MDVVMTSKRLNDLVTTLFWRRVPCGTESVNGRDCGWCGWCNVEVLIIKNAHNILPPQYFYLLNVIKTKRSEKIKQSRRKPFTCLVQIKKEGRSRKCFKFKNISPIVSLFKFVNISPKKSKGILRRFTTGGLVSIYNLYRVVSSSRIALIFVSLSSKNILKTAIAVGELLKNPVVKVLIPGKNPQIVQTTKIIPLNVVHILITLPVAFN